VLIAVALVFAGSPTALHAQTTSASVTGSVQDSQGGVLPGANITVANVETGFARETVADTRGFYRVPALPPGRYEIRATLQGFVNLVRAGVVLTIGQEATINMSLKIATVAETVTVTGDSPLVETTSNTLERTFPQGLDAEAVSASAMAIAACEARDPYEREHVTPYIYNRPDRFSLRNVRAAADGSDLRWTLDTPADYEYLQAVFARVDIPAKTPPPFEFVARIVREDAGLMALNARAAQATAVPAR